MIPAGDASRGAALPGLGFEFATAGRIVFGGGRISELAGIAKTFGRRIMLVTGASPARLANIIEALRSSAEELTVWSVSGEPTVDAVESGAAEARRTRSGVVVAIGGGSVLDAGKAVAALAANDGPALDYLEVVGRGLPLQSPPLPCIAVPTTAGTGAEVTRNAVLGVPAARVKVSLRHPLMLPRVALVDPTLTHQLPAAQTATTGMDALTQLIEAFLCIRANPLTDALCRDGIRRAAAALPVAFAEPQDVPARADMSLAALFSGIALANAGLGAVHGFAAPIGGMFAAPHGAVCAALLAPVFRANLESLRALSADHLALPRFHEVARLVTGSSEARADDAVEWLAGLTRRLRIPGLSSWGMTAADLDAIAEKAAAASSMKANPVPFTKSGLRAILESAIG